jgi:hypothetical protein
MSLGKGCGAIALVMLALLFPVAAFATAPKNVTITASGGKIIATWDDPAVDGSSVPSAFEIAHSPKTAGDGSFTDSATIRAPLDPADTSYTFPPLPNGTYYVHVGAYELANPSCDVDPTTGDLRCPTDWSPTLTLKIGSGPQPLVTDTVTGFKSLRVAARQKAAKLIVQASMPEAGTITVGGTVSVPGAAKAFRIKAVSARAPAGKAVDVKVKLSKQALKAIGKALKRHKKVKARLTITAKDAAGNKKTEKRSVQLK